MQEERRVGQLLSSLCFAALYSGVTMMLKKTLWWGFEASVCDFVDIVK